MIQTQPFAANRSILFDGLIASQELAHAYYAPATQWAGADASYQAAEKDGALATKDKTCKPTKNPCCKPTKDTKAACCKSPSKAQAHGGSIDLMMV
jgi:hypothetical protein